MSEDPSRYWSCGRCGRNVPPGLTVCRCGFPRGSSAPGAPDGPAAPRSRLWLGLTIAVSLTIAFAVAALRDDASQSEIEPLSTSSSVPAESAEPPREPPPMRSPVVTIVGPSESATEDAAIAYEETVASLARMADEVDTSWKRYRRDCAPYTSGETFGRDWFGVWSSSLATADQPVSDCRPRLAPILAAAAEVKAGMDAAELQNVPPGTKLDIRRKYRMDSREWGRD